MYVRVCKCMCVCVWKVFPLRRVAGNVSIAPWVSENEILDFIYLFLLEGLECVWYSMLNNALLGSLLWAYPSRWYSHMQREKNYTFNEGTSSWIWPHRFLFCVAIASSLACKQNYHWALLWYLSFGTTHANALLSSQWSNSCLAHSRSVQTLHTVVFESHSTQCSQNT